MNTRICLLVASLCLLFPGWSIAQSSTTQGKQLPGQALAVVTPSTAVAPAPAVRVLTGTVLDEWDEPLAGAMVTVVSEPNLSGITNSAGGYVLRTTAVAPVLRVTYAGYRDKQVESEATTPSLVQLEPVDNYERQLKKTLRSAEKAYRKP